MRRLLCNLKGIVVSACLFSCFFCSPVYATDIIDITTGFKTLLLMKDKYTGPIPVAVVYNPASPESASDAERIKKNIDSGSGVPRGLALNAYLVSIAHPEKLLGAKVAFLADNTSSRGLDSVCDVAGKNGILTISKDINCVKANKCILGIISSPRVEIYYSPVAAEASHISFAPAFIMMVKQI